MGHLIGSGVQAQLADSCECGEDHLEQHSRRSANSSCEGSRSSRRVEASPSLRGCEESQLPNRLNMQVDDADSNQVLPSNTLCCCLIQNVPRPGILHWQPFVLG